MPDQGKTNELLFMSEFSSSADKVASIDHVLTKIFEYLPLKSIVRFEAVCKHWFSLITDPHFSINLLKPRHASGLFLLPSKPNGKPFSCEVDFLPLDGQNSCSLVSVCESKDVKILHSCNGLMLLCSNPNASGGDTKYFVCNPTTKNIITLSWPVDGPYKSWRQIQIQIHGLYLAYDPMESPYYKVIRVWRYEGDLLYKISIYSSQTRVWRVFKSNEYFYYSNEVHFEKGAYWNNAIHWYCDTDNWLYFDIDEEKLNIMPAPKKLDGNFLESPCAYFGESSGHLHVVEDCKRTGVFYVYEMEKDYSGWHTKCKVMIEAIAVALPERIKLKYPTEEGIIVLSIIYREKDEDLILVLLLHGCTVRYSPRYETVEILIDFGSHYVGYRKGEVSNWGWYDAFQYIESLASV